jgi:hypothetical protein
MFILDGKPLSPDVAFTTGGIQYPANWLRLASPEEREAIGITEVPDPTPYDQRFYWGPDLPKDHGQLVEQWTQQTRTTANSLLQPSDWMVIREADNGTEMDAGTKALREDIRLATGQKKAAIEATADTAELAAYITSSEYSQWPPYPAPDLVRARNADGTFASDDPATPDVDEAWEPAS